MKMQAARWLFPDVDEAAAAQIATALGLPVPVARVLWARGHRDPAAARRFLAHSLDELHDPHLLEGMPAATSRLLRAIERKERILLYGDYDVDGTTSVVILHKAIELAGGVSEYWVPHRLRDGYGMRPEVIERAAASKVGLIVSVDTGIRASAVVRHANELGIDVIITDHHLPEAELPPAVAVLNPNRPDCRYPDKNLCGAGVAFKLVQALFQGLGWEPARIRRLTESFLKLVAVATVADVVPLTGENRIIVKQGLEGFRDVRNMGLRALLDVAGFSNGQCPSAGQVAFRIAPRMNAAGRMDTASDVIRLFLTTDQAEARTLATRLHDLNKERQDTEADMLRRILEECEREPVSPDQSALVFAGEGWHRGVVGIVASRVVERFHRPAFILGVDPATGEATGSGRSIPAFHLLEALESMPELFTRFGGHRQAAGVTLPADRVPEFRERFNAWACARLTAEDLEPVLELDARLDFTDLRDETAAAIMRLAPFGFGNPTPVFGIERVRVVGNPTVMKERHLSVRFEQNGRIVTAKAWNAAEHAGRFAPGALMDLAVCLVEDQYAARQGWSPWSLQLEGARPSEAAASARG
jgi:single-stranded-DNA-specific exonuclease